MIFLIGCQSNPKTDTEYLKMPDEYLSKCPKDFKDGSIKEVILGMDNTIGCYENKQQSIKELIDDDDKE